MPTSPPGRKPPLLEYLRDRKPALTRRGGYTAEDTHETSANTGHWQSGLFNPVDEILSRPGKAFRGQLCEATFYLTAPGGAFSQSASRIVEVLHAGSLLVDDIEDRGVWRRGGPAVHLMYGTAATLNAGNWMYFWAVDQVDELPLDEPSKANLSRNINRTMMDCHRGQALDIALTFSTVNQTDIPTVVAEMTELKTGALMALAADLGVSSARGSHGQRGCQNLRAQAWRCPATARRLGQSGQSGIRRKTIRRPTEWSTDVGMGLGRECLRSQHFCRACRPGEPSRSEPDGQHPGLRGLSPPFTGRHRRPATEHPHPIDPGPCRS